MQRTTIGHLFILSRTADLIAVEGVEHFGITARRRRPRRTPRADQDGGADDGDDVEPDDVAALDHAKPLEDGGNVYQSGWRIKSIKPR